MGVERRTVITQQPLPYELLRSKRKTLTVTVTEQGTIQVRAPLRLSEKQVRAFVEKHHDFLLKTAAERQSAWQEKQSFSVTEGDSLMLFGREYPVRFSEKSRFTGECFEIPQGGFETVKGDIVREYKRLAKLWILKRVADLSRQIGVVPQAVRVNSAKTRWGSCSGKNTLNFSWRLILADPDTIDYVIIHELCHIRHHNHSPAFWQMVAGFVPDYRSFQQRLKCLSERLQRENWE